MSMPGSASRSDLAAVVACLMGKMHWGYSSALNTSYDDAAKVLDGIMECGSTQLSVHC